MSITKADIDRLREAQNRLVLALAARERSAMDFIESRLNGHTACKVLINAASSESLAAAVALDSITVDLYRKASQ